MNRGSMLSGRTCSHGGADVRGFFEDSTSEAGTPYDTPLSSFRQRILSEGPPLEAPPPEPTTGDRMIPERNTISNSMVSALYETNVDKVSQHMQPQHMLHTTSQPTESFKTKLTSALFPSNGLDENAMISDRILPIGGVGGPTPEGDTLPPSAPGAQYHATPHHRNLRAIYSKNKQRNFRSRTFRYIPQTPERILDGPDLVDDYYLNLLDWSPSNILSVALKQTVFLWKADSGDITQLTRTREQNNIVTGLSFSRDAPTLAVGTNSADVELWDVGSGTKTATLKGHIARVVSLSWNGSLLASGSRDSCVNLYDVRTGGGAVAVLSAHEQEVCGLSWSLDGSQLASGGNDNLIHIWDNRSRAEPRLRLAAHTAAVKAIGWSPHQGGLLATGGGTADRTLRFWNTSNGECVNTIDTKSQVCSLLWSVNRNELLTSHGYSENQLSLWKYPSMKRIANLTGHSSRVLHLALSPDGQTVVSAAGDETIRFWKCFAEEKPQRRHHIAKQTLLSPLAMR